MAQYLAADVDHLFRLLPRLQAVYAVLGMYMYKIGKDPAAHKALIGFVIWGNFAHLVVLFFAVAFDDVTSYAGPTMMGIELPAKMFGIAHWQNVSPIGDVPLMILFTFGDLFLAYKAFGSMLSPMDF